MSLSISRALAVAGALTLLAACSGTEPTRPAAEKASARDAQWAMAATSEAPETFVAVGAPAATSQGLRRLPQLVAPPPGYMDAIVNGGFESGWAGWTRTASGYGYGNNLSLAWIVGSTDGNYYYGGMPHNEPLAHSGSAGASAIEDGSTLHRLYQDVAIFNDGTSRPVILTFWLRWKNQSGAWTRYDPTCETINCQDIVVQVRNPVTNALITELWSAYATNAPMFSGGGDFYTANYQGFSYNLSAFKGSMVRLQFENRVCCYFQYLDIDDVQLMVPVNLPPVANAGPDQVVEATGPAGALVRLNGAASFDPEGDTLTYFWREGLSLIGYGKTPLVPLGLGVHTIVLTVQDAMGAMSADTVVVTVRDTTAPVIRVGAHVASLWPPNHALLPVVTGITVSDTVDANPLVTVTVTSNEAEDGLGDGDTAPDWMVSRALNGAWNVEVRAERSGTGTGRTYTVVITATDASGNAATRTLLVTVPLSQRNK